MVEGVSDSIYFLQHRPPPRAAFTLLELLVVIAVLALLLAVLTPFYGKALNLAREGACKSNLRNWGIGFLAYAADHKGFLPHPDGPEREVKGTDRGQHGWMDVVPPYMGLKPWNEHPPGKRPTGNPWQCPSARVEAAARDASSPKKDDYFSYAMNSYLSHDFDFGLPWGAEQQPSFLFMGRSVAPSVTILMFEQSVDPKKGNGGRFGGEDAGAVTARHAHLLGGEGCNVLYLDGHVAWRNDLWDPESKNPRIPKRGDLTWFPYPY